MDARPIDILLVEDSPTDQLLAKSALAETSLKANVQIVSDGVEALAYLRAEGRYAGAPRPDLILLDLNLPKKDGRQVLEEIKSSDQLKQIPVVVLTTSEADSDVDRCYAAHANCYISKPVDFETFKLAIQAVERFWFGVVRLPHRRRPAADV